MLIGIKFSIMRNMIMSDNSNNLEKLLRIEMRL
jgi:hypothetical protein